MVSVKARSSRQASPPPGVLVDVGGHRVHALCSGEGAPVVLFESGVAASSLSWVLVQPEVARFTRACTYDRAGLDEARVRDNLLTTHCYWKNRRLDRTRGASTVVGDKV